MTFSVFAICGDPRLLLSFPTEETHCSKDRVSLQYVAAVLVKVWVFASFPTGSNWSVVHYKFASIILFVAPSKSAANLFAASHLLLYQVCCYKSILLLQVIIDGLSRLAFWACYWHLAIVLATGPMLASP
ncbi:hypothetical protein U1Q18_049131 [Sarracenia purpurea var. burkii]